jgi:acetyl-CoA carboxylase biotin carboxyl carrier protein
MSKNILEVFDGGTVANIAALIDKLAESSFDYLELEDGGMRLVIGKNGVREVSGTAAAKAETPAQAGVDGERRQAVIAAAEQAAQEEAAPSQAQKTPVTEQPGVVVIRSPSYGMFYAQQEPGVPPFIRVGQTVKKGDTVGLLEIMKTFNAVTSPVDGRVIAIHVTNEELLEPDQPLCSIQVT